MPNDKTDDDLFVEYHFLAQITLRTQINRARNATRQTSRSPPGLKDFWSDSATDLGREGTLLQEWERWPAARAALIEELSSQLENWRLTLPQIISFSDDSDEQLMAEALTPMDPTATGRLDIHAVLRATLRTRYKYAQYIIWRPYIHQLLHVQMDPSLHSIEASLKALKVSAITALHT